MNEQNALVSAGGAPAGGALTPNRYRALFPGG
jgi:hypothetical protein